MIQMKVLGWNNDQVVQISLKEQCKSHENKLAICFVLIRIILTLHVHAYFVVNKPLFLKRALPSANNTICSRHVIGIQPIGSLASRAWQRFLEKHLNTLFIFTEKCYLK